MKPNLNKIKETAKMRSSESSASHVGQLLRDSRISNGVKIREIAEVVGKTVQLVSQWERGTVIPSTHNMEKICIAYPGITKEDFVRALEEDEVFQKVAPSEIWKIQVSQALVPIWLVQLIIKFPQEPELSDEEIHTLAMVVHQLPNNISEILFKELVTNIRSVEKIKEVAEIV